MKTLTAVLALALLAVSPPAKGASESLSTDDVMAMAARLPAEGKTVLGGYEKAKDAYAIAAGIAETAPSRERAALMLTFAAYESGLTIAARGDGGASRGPWQLKYVPDEVAFDPARAAHYWLYLAAGSERTCASNPPDERLASLASGSCQKARAKVRRRVETARRIAQGD